LAYAAVFLAVFIPMAFMTSRFSDSVKNSPIGPLDRAAGVAFGVVRGLVIVGLGYLAFTYFVPIRSQPRWLTEARLLPVVQSTADVLLSVVPDHPRDYTYVPKHEEEVRQAPPAASHDPMADLIRKNEAANSVPKTTPKADNVPVQHKTATRVTKSYGATDRQALDKLVETGGTNR
jgi:membrane protein required for colicin V production